MATPKTPFTASIFGAPGSVRAATAAGDASMIRALKQEQAAQALAAAGQAADVETNADRIWQALTTAGNSRTNFGQSYDLNRPELLREMLNTPGGRELAAHLWSQLEPGQQNKIREEILLAFPGARGPRSQSLDAQKVLDFLDRGDYPEGMAADALGDIQVPMTSQVSDDVGRSMGGEAIDRTPDDPDAVMTSLEDPEYAFDLPAEPALREPGAPVRPNTSAAVKKKQKEQGLASSSPETRPRFRTGDAEIIYDKDGNPVRFVDPESSYMTRSDERLIKQGEAWEQANEQFIARHLELLTEIEGSEEAVQALFRKAAAGDEAAKARISAARTQVEQEVRIPKKPKPVSDQTSTGRLKPLPGDMSQQQVVDEAVTKLAMGNPSSPVYRQIIGDRDFIQALWDDADAARGGRRDPRTVFSSPEEMAEFVINRRASPALFDSMPVTARERALATDALSLGGGARNNYRPEDVAAVAREYAPVDAARKGELRKQATERLAAEFRRHLGDQWGDKFVPSASDAPAAPASSGIPPVREGTSMDPGPLRAGEKPPATPAKVPEIKARPSGQATRFEEMLAREMDLLDGNATDQDVLDASRRAYDGSRDKPPEEMEAQKDPSRNPFQHQENLRNPGNSDSALATRDSMIDQGFYPHLEAAKGRKTSDILKEMDAVEEELQSLSRAPGSRKNAEVNNRAQELEERLARLQMESQISRMADRLAGVSTIKKAPPLSGRIKPKVPDPGIDIDVVAPGAPPKGPPKGPVDSPAADMSPKPDQPGPVPPSDPGTGMIPVDGSGSANSDVPNFRRQPESTDLSVAERGIIDNLESAHASDMDILDAEFEVIPDKSGPPATVPGGDRGAAQADGPNFRRDPNAPEEGSLPRDTTPRERFESKGDLIPGKPKDPDAPASPDDIDPKTGKPWGWKKKALIGAGAGLAALVGIPWWLQSTFNPGDKPGLIPGAGPNPDGEGPSMTGSYLTNPDAAGADPWSSAVSPEDRVRMLQKMKGPRRRSQTMENWTGELNDL